MATFADRLKALRNMHHLTQDELSKITGVSRSAIGMYESGKRKPDYNQVEVFADFFNVDFNYILGQSDKTTVILPSTEGFKGNPTPNPNVIKPSADIPVYKIPVLGTIVAGIPITAVENIIDYEEISQEMAKTGEYFALVVKGSSMEPKIYEGDVVIVKKQSTVDNGDIAIVLVNGNEATIKQIQRSQSGITLVGFNVAVYPPHIYTNEEIEDLPVNVIGKAVEVRRKL